MDVKPLSIPTIREQWSKTYNKEGKPDWAHIFPYYDQSIVFEDVIQKIVGFKDFEAMCNRLTKRCKSLSMDIHNVTQSDNTFMLEWTMTMAFRSFPSTPMKGASRLTLNKEGKIIEQRDYYDLHGDIRKNIPGYKHFYKWFMRKFFG
jgi:hypothetical protein